MQNSTFIGLNSVFSTFVNNHVVHLECGFCLSYESVWIISTVFSPLSSIVMDEKYYINSLIIFNIDLFDKCHVKPRELYRFFNSHNLGFCPFVYSQSIKKKKKLLKLLGWTPLKQQCPVRLLHYLCALLTAVYRPMAWPTILVIEAKSFIWSQTLTSGSDRGPRLNQDWEALQRQTGLLPFVLASVALKKGSLILSTFGRGGGGVKKSWLVSLLCIPG